VILAAANDLGEDGQGLDGLVGYMRMLEREDSRIDTWWALHNAFSRAVMTPARRATQCSVTLPSFCPSRSIFEMPAAGDCSGLYVKPSWP
jgi:hypothetical protein